MDTESRPTKPPEFSPWSRDYPTEKGWYLQRERSDLWPKIVYIRPNQSGPMIQETGRMYWLDYRVDFEWSGPFILPPENQKS